MNWFYNSTNHKSFSDLDKLVNDVILAKDFKKHDLIGFRATREAERLDNANTPLSRFPDQDGWSETCVKISLPAQRVNHATEAEAPVFEVPGLFHRRLTHVIRAALQETATKMYHLFPFHEYWQPSPDSPPRTHLVGVVYSRCLYCWAREDPVTTTRGRLRKCDHWLNALVRLNPSHKFWQRVVMANIPIHRKPLQVYSRKANFFLCTSFGVHPKGESESFR